MANTSVFALQQSELNGFLFANIGVEQGGMPLSVLSALARNGVDPWQEAARLARLPPIVAVEGLAGIIASMPASTWPLPAATSIATRLVRLLPGNDAGRPAGGEPIERIRLFDGTRGVLPGLTRERLSAILLATAIAVGAALAMWRAPPAPPALSARADAPIASAQPSSGQ